MQMLPAVALGSPVLFPRFPFPPCRLPSRAPGGLQAAASHCPNQRELKLTACTLEDPSSPFVHLTSLYLVERWDNGQGEFKMDAAMPRLEALQCVRGCPAGAAVAAAAGHSSLREVWLDITDY